MDWTKDNAWEAEWWGTCQNTYGEEMKQLTYAKYMGLKLSTNPSGSPCIDAMGKSILDVGGGPVSMLLKCYNLDHGLVIDPCRYPDWVTQRYGAAHIHLVAQKAEEMDELGWGRLHRTDEAGEVSPAFDEVWIYNCLQHVEDPRKILQNARKVANTMRIFEWVDAGVSPGHPHNLTKQMFETILGPGGQVKKIGHSWAPSKAYFGVFEWGGKHGTADRSRTN